MIVQTYKKAIYYLKSTGICVVLFSGCWLLYQIRQTSIILKSIVPTDVLDLENKQASYIYIDDPRYKDIFKFKHENDLQSSLQEKPKNLSDVVSSWWKNLNQNLAFRLLHLARTGDTAERRKAIHTLSSLKYLKDWHYHQIGQMLDAQTAVALARSPNADLRFFLKPPYFHEQFKVYEVVEKLQELLTKLNVLCGGCHPCLLRFLHKKFENFSRDISIFEHDITSNGLSSHPSIAWNLDFLQNCVFAVQHHSSLEEHSKDIADAGGLQILLNVYKLVGNNIEICSAIAKILSNLSLHPEYLEDIFKSGWIGILALWSRHENIKIAAPASRALTNLDFDDVENVKYPQRIYPLYPLHRASFKKTLDVIFIHGLLGSVFFTWRQRDIDPSAIPDSKKNLNSPSLNEMVDIYSSEFFKDLANDFESREWQQIGSDFEVILHDCPISMNNKASGPFSCKGDDPCMQQNEKECKIQSQCWPKDWLAKDVPNLRIIGVNYNTNLSMWTPLCPIEGVRSTIKERSIEFTPKLVKAGVGNRSIIWVCHSMGGLIVKKMLVEEWKNGDKNNLLRNTKGIIFYSTPHRGTHIVTLSQIQRLLWPSVEVQELQEQSPQLLELHKDFLNMLEEHKIEIISFAETKPTRVTALKVPFQFVNSSSADPGVGEFFEIPQNHLYICKPVNRQSFLYQKVLTMIKRYSQNEEKRDFSKTLFSFLK